MLFLKIHQKCRVPSPILYSLETGAPRFCALYYCFFFSLSPFFYLVLFLIFTFGNKYRSFELFPPHPGFFRFI